MSKITKATLKSFIRKNAGKLYIKVPSRFDGMEDGVRDTGDRSFSKCVAPDYTHENNLGIQGVWLTHSGNHFSRFDDGMFTGIDVYNCCGHFTLTIKK